MKASRRLILVGVTSVAGFGCKAPTSLNPMEMQDWSASKTRYISAEMGSGQPITSAEAQNPLNAALDFREACQEVRIDSGDSKAVLEALRRGNSTPAVAMVASWDPALEYAHQGASQPKFEWAGDEHTSLSNIRDVVRGLTVRAELRCSQGDDADCLKDLSDGWAISQLVGSDDKGVGGIIGPSVSSIVLISIENVAGRMANDLVRLRRLAAGFPAPSKQVDAIARIQKDSQIYMDVAVETYYQGTTDNGYGKLNLGDRSLYIRDLYDYWADVAGPLLDKSLSLAEKQRRIDAITAKWKGKGPVEQAMLNDIDRPEVVPEWIKTGQARYRATKAVVQSLLLRSQTGKFPTSLVAVGTPIDPFTGRPMHMLVTDHSIRIYALGSGLKDWHGLDSREANSSHRENSNVASAYPPIKEWVPPSKPNPTQVKPGMPGVPNGSRRTMALTSNFTPSRRLGSTSIGQPSVSVLGAKKDH